VVIICTTNSYSYKGLLYKLRPVLRPFLSKKRKRWADRKDVYNLTARALRQLLEEHNFQFEQALGLNWLPVGRRSDSFLIPVWARLEQYLALTQRAQHSPWILLQARVR
jgi:hypothetical protein